MRRDEKRTYVLLPVNQLFFKSFMNTRTTKDHSFVYEGKRVFFLFWGRIDL